MSYFLNDKHAGEETQAHFVVVTNLGDQYCYHGRETLFQKRPWTSWVQDTWTTVT